MFSAYNILHPSECIALIHHSIQYRSKQTKLLM